MLQPLADAVFCDLLGFGQIELAARLVEAGLHMSTGGLQPLLKVAADTLKDQRQFSVSNMVCKYVS